MDFVAKTPSERYIYILDNRFAENYIFLQKKLPQNNHHLDHCIPIDNDIVYDIIIILYSTCLINVIALNPFGH